MNYADKIALARAGYSRAEIESMDTGSTTPAAAPEPAGKAAENPEPEAPPAPAEQAPAQVTAQVTEPMPQPHSIDDAMLQQILGGMSTLTAALQAANRAGVTGTTPPAEASGMDAIRAATARMMGQEVK